MSLIRPKSYQVLITPLVRRDVYGTEQDVTLDVEIDDFIKDSGISKIKREVDNGDFDFGVFTFDSINLTALNFGGKFSSYQDSRSMFKYSRDKAKVVINFFDGVSNTATLSFRGLIDDRSTKINFEKNEVKFKILSNDSIINRVKVPGGVVTNGISASQAIKNILQITDITSVLNYDDANINVLNDYDIDNGAFFDNKTAKQALDFLLSVTNSVLVVDKSSDDIIVRSRDENSGTILRLYGHGDLFGRENIINIKNYNDGLQRAFNTIIIETISSTNAGLVDQFGDNTKTFRYDFITDDTTRKRITDDLLDYWKAPKIELEAQVRTDLVKDVGFFDLVSIDYPYRKKPYKDEQFPVYGVSTYGDAVYPYIFGNLKIDPNRAFKVIGIKEDPRTFLTTLKLRQNGTEISDGYFSDLGTFYGVAIYGADPYQLDPNRLDPNRNSAYGAAVFGTVIYGF